METLNYHEFMPLIAYQECSGCHAHFPAETAQTQCPQCGGRLVAGEEGERDHRGVILPARHRAGGIITPQ
jgi:DNA-directed RNA polymerase subunit RPC12/RpoP